MRRLLKVLLDGAYDLWTGTESGNAYSFRPFSNTPPFAAGTTLGTLSPHQNVPK